MTKGRSEARKNLRSKKKKGFRQETSNALASPRISTLYKWSKSLDTELVAWGAKFNQAAKVGAFIVGVLYWLTILQSVSRKISSAKGRERSLAAKERQSQAKTLTEQILRHNNN